MPTGSFRETALDTEVVLVFITLVLTWIIESRLFTFAAYKLGALLNPLSNHGLVLVAASFTVDIGQTVSNIFR